MRVVRHIEHQGRLAGHDLEAAGQIDRGQALAHGLGRHRQAFAQGFERGQHARRIDELVGAAQRRVGHAAVAPAAPRPVPLLAVATVVEVAADQPQVGANRLRMRDHRLRRHGIADDRRLARAHHLRLLGADRFAVRAKVLGVVQVDAGDDGAIGIDGIDRVVATAEADFEDHEIERCMGQQMGDGQRRELELGQRDVAARGLDRGEMRQQFIGSDGLPADAAALLEVHQLRLLVQADAPARRQGDRLQHRAGGALAIGAGHRDHRHVERQAEALLDLDRALQRQVHRYRVHALAVREPVGKGLRCHATASALWRCSIASVRAITPRSWRRSTIMSIAPF